MKTAKNVTGLQPNTDDLLEAEVSPTGKSDHVCLKILQTCPGYPPSVQIGGAGLSAAATSLIAFEAGCSVTVLAPKLRGTKYSRPLTETESISKAAGFRIIECGTWIQRGFKTFNPAGFHLVPRHAAAADLVVIHGLRLFLGTLAGCFCRITGKPYVIFPHGMAVPRWRARRMKWAYDFVLGNKILRGASAVFCLSQREREETIEAAGLEPTRVRVVSISRPLGPHGDLGGPVTWVRATIAYLCRVVREKGIELTVEALANSDLSNRYEIVVGGPIEDEKYAKEVQLAAESAGVRLRFAGMVSEEERNTFLNGSHLLALTSEFESWGRVVSEALQVGTPVLVTDTCGVASELSPTEGMVVPRNLGSIKTALQALSAADFRKLRELRASCRDGSLNNRKADVMKALTDVFEASRKALRSDAAQSTHILGTRGPQ
ncbi:MAG: glycosyltransferase family 4 protein [Bryobacteraceae bacterium]